RRQGRAPHREGRRAGRRALGDQRGTQVGRTRRDGGPPEGQGRDRRAPRARHIGCGRARTAREGITLTMSRFFIERPIVAIVIAIFFVIGGAVIVVPAPAAPRSALAPPPSHTTPISNSPSPRS